MSQTLWKWANDPELRYKRCKHCNEPMLYGRASAVQYQNELYHDYCLLTYLTEYHTKQIVKDDEKSEINESHYNFSFAP